jgi:hypothetical protein
MIQKQTARYSWPGLITILVLVVILVGALGYTWWQNSPRIQLLASTPGASTTPTPNKEATSITSQDENYLVVKEWGVKLKTSLVDHLTYQPQHMDNTGSPTPYDELGLRLKSSSVSNQECVTFGADLYRQLTPSDRFAAKKIGDYYYYVTGAPGVCSEEPSDVQLQQTILTELTLSNIEKIDE